MTISTREPVLRVRKNQPAHIRSKMDTCDGCVGEALEVQAKTGDESYLNAALADRRYFGTGPDDLLKVGYFEPGIGECDFVLCAHHQVYYKVVK